MMQISLIILKHSMFVEDLLIRCSVLLMTKKLSLDKYVSCLCTQFGDITSVS